MTSEDTRVVNTCLAVVGKSSESVPLPEFSNHRMEVVVVTAPAHAHTTGRGGEVVRRHGV